MAAFRSPRFDVSKVLQGILNDPDTGTNIKSERGADAEAQRRVWDLLAAVDARLVDSDREGVAAHDLHDEHGLPA